MRYIMDARGNSQSLDDTPCIGICSATQWGDAICKGCGRTVTEIRDWNLFPPIYKKLVILRAVDEGYTPDRYILMKTILIKTAIDVESARSSQAKTNLLALCENGMAIPEHSDLVQEILKQTTIKAEADENVRVLQELLLE